jgi:hypothetical protein
MSLGLWNLCTVRKVDKARKTSDSGGHLQVTSIITLLGFTMGL